MSHPSGKRSRLVRNLLLTIPVCIYMFSYMYLAWYHARFNLLTTVVHESGKFTLTEDILYASHFLGHIPVHTMLAFLFTGVCLSLTGGIPPAVFSKPAPRRLLISLSLFLALSLAGSILFFGFDDTAAFILQQKQSEHLSGGGGSWNLHLPSSMLLFCFIPVYLAAIFWFIGRRLELSGKGIAHIVISSALLVLMTLLVNGSLSSIAEIWQAPRYLAHSVRELATFPLTYFPLPLYFILAKEDQAYQPARQQKRSLVILLIILAALFFAGITYQAVVSLNAGISALAQKPAFAKGGMLDIPYLLASHYFEHFLDTIFFSLLVLLLYDRALRTNSSAE